MQELMDSRTDHTLAEQFSAALDWVEADISGRRRYIFDVLKFIRLPLVPSKLLDSYMSGCHDLSVKVALNSVKKDLVQRKGSLVTLNAQPRLSAKVRPRFAFSLVIFSGCHVNRKRKDMSSEVTCV